MTTEKNRDQLIEEACTIASHAFLKHLGKNPQNEDIFKVILYLSHSFLTHNGTFSLSIARHNTEFFTERLKQIVEETQRNVNASGQCGRLM